MKEIITVQLGQCGNQIGWRFWDCVAAEHASYADAGAAGTFFSRSSDGTQRARALLVDMEEGVVSQLMRSPLSNLFHHNLAITDVSGCGNNWAAGYADFGPRYGPDVVDGVRKLLEECESPQCLSIMHSVGGGTGSGLGSWVLEHLADSFPELYRLTTSVLPAALDDVVTSPYNAVLSLAMLREHADCVFAVENDALANHPIVKEYESTQTHPRLPQPVQLSARTGGRGNSFIEQQRSEEPARVGRGDGITSGANSGSNSDAGAAVLDILATADITLERANANLHLLSSKNKRARPAVPAVLKMGSGTVTTSLSRRRQVEPVPLAGKSAGRTQKTVTGIAIAAPTSTSLRFGRDVAGFHPPGSASVETSKSRGQNTVEDGSSLISTARSAPVPRPSGSAFDGMNEVVARMLADMTASARFPGTMNVDLNEIATTLVPFPKLQFLTTSLAMAPTTPGHGGQTLARTNEEVIEGLVAGTFAKRSALITADLARERHIALACLVRGTDSIAAFTDTLGRLRRDLRLVPWNEYGFKSGLCSVPPPWSRATALGISNNVCVRTPLARSYDRFLRMYRARAHLHHYLAYLDAEDIVQSAHSVVGAVEAYEELAGPAAKRRSR